MLAQVTGAIKATDGEEIAEVIPLTGPEVSVTGPLNPLMGVSVRAAVADRPGAIGISGVALVMEKSGWAVVTLTGLELPAV